MPVNMDPKRKRRPAAPPPEERAPSAAQRTPSEGDPNAPTEADLAEKEWKNLWEATEVIDMDRW